MWITEQQYRFTPVKHTGWVWSYAFKKDGFGFSIYQKNGRPESLFVAVNAELDDYRQRIDALSELDRAGLLFDLRFALLNFDVEFDIPKNELKTVNISWQIFAESLTRAEFWRVAFQIQKALLATMWTLERRLLTPSE